MNGQQLKNLEDMGYTFVKLFGDLEIYSLGINHVLYDPEKDVIITKYQEVDPSED